MTAIIDTLRARVLAGTQPQDFRLFLDPQARAAVDLAATALDRARLALAESGSLAPEERPKRKIGDPDHRTVLTRAVTDAEASLAAAQDAAAESTLILRFAAMDPDDYNTMAAKFFDVATGTFDRPAINRAAAAASFVGAFSIYDEPIDVQWTQVRKLLNNADYDVLLEFVMGVNRAPSLAPFVRASSGRPATS